MPSATSGPQAPSLTTFLKSLKQNDVETSIELFISLLKRRQIKNPRPCAIATAQLLLRIVASDRTRDAQKLIDKIRLIGRRLISAQPREMVVGNIVRRILGVVREVVERDSEATLLDDGPHVFDIAETSGRRPAFPSRISDSTPLAPIEYGDNVFFNNAHPQRPPLVSSSTSYAGPMTSLFNIFQQPFGRSPLATPPIGTQSPAIEQSPRKLVAREESKEKLDIKAEVIEGIRELIDELDIVDNQISEYALDHIHSNEIILTQSSSQTVQRFLIAAARKRKFTVIHAEAYPNDHQATHATIVNGGKSSNEDGTEDRWKPLTTLGITVIVVPDTAVFALMSRINKVILAPHTVMANGSLLAVAGASSIAQAAKEHRVPVVVLSGIYKLSPVYPFDVDELIEYGDPGKLVAFEEGEYIDKVDIVNPLYDYVDADLVDLYITNLGGHAPSYLYRIVADHYRPNDIDLSG